MSFVFKNLGKNLVTDRLGGFSKPPYDSFNLGFHTGDDAENVAKNRAKLAADFGREKIVFMNQIHSDLVVKIDEFPIKTPECDALITDRARVALAVMTADCAPILFYDPARGAIGAAHAGWRGTRSFIAAKTALAMRENYGVNFADLRVGIAPAICGKCYEIGEEVAAKWRELPSYLQAALNENHLDLQLANRLILREIGVLDENIETIAECTLENPALFSHRRANPSGRFVSLISL
ncbi:MAG: peptidoglycan editing factor PgeF [Helicobacteraceae bacterium]|jgi:YfiH family protein|nr:peptidoglycan editing factor PgeF [Helicobacteraceae bacterium]